MYQCSPVVSQDLLGCRQVSAFTGDAVSDLLSFFTSFSVTGYTFDFEGLSDMREVKILIDFCGHPDFSGFVTTMIGLVLGGMVWLPVDIFKP